jgi:anaerobic magnesium-protoporphyrin IX monomethyl ester cyclase
VKIIVATLNAKYIHTCLALRYLKAYSQADFAMDIAEYTIKDPIMNIVSDLFQRKPNIIGFSCYIWNIEETLQVVRLLRKIMPELTIVLGGPEVSYDTEQWLVGEPEVDMIVMGEGESTFHHLLQELHSDRKFHYVFGLVYRKEGQVVINPPRPKLDLGDIPSPYRFEEDKSDLGKRVVYFETSRGCPFSCQFCLSSIEVGVRYFHMERTKADLLYLIQSGAKLIKFVDRTFNIKRDYAMEVFQFLIDNHRGCTFQFEITADIMRPEVLDFLKEHAPAGVFRFEIGVQSTNEKTNELIERRQNFTKLSRTVNTIKNSGNIDQHLDLIAGLPEEDYASFRHTFNDVFALRAEELQLGFLKMLRGTGMRRDADKYGYIYMDRAPYEILGNDILPFEDLFLRLQQFLTHRGVQHPEVVWGLMKLDYFLNHRYKPRKNWWPMELNKSEFNQTMRYFAEHADEVSAEFAALKLDERDLHKHTVVQVLPFDLADLLERGIVNMDANTALIVYYTPDLSGPPQWFGSKGIVLQA